MKKIALLLMCGLTIITSLEGISSSAPKAIKMRFFTIFGPVQYSRTYEDRIKITGSVKDKESVKELKVNDKNLALQEDGNFGGGLILKPGKNAAEVKIVQKSGISEKVILKVMREIKYLDADDLYNGKQHWARDLIMKMATLDIVESYPDGRFMPNNDVTKGEFATWLFKCLGLTTEEVSQDVFYDVPKDHWRAPYIDAIVKQSYMTGRMDGYFGVDDPINRCDAVVVALKAENVSPDINAKGGKFLDVNPTDDRYFIIQTAALKGLIKGISTNPPLFDPDRNISRAETAALLSRLPIIKKRMSMIDNWETGFDSSSRCSVVSLPQIARLSVEPKDVAADGKGTVNISAEIGDYEDKTDIMQVKTDLTKIGGPPNALMYDDGTNGDQTAGDYIYSLSLPINGDVVPGEKRLVITVTDRNGWETSGQVIVNVIPAVLPGTSGAR